MKLFDVCANKLSLQHVLAEGLSRAAPAASGRLMQFLDFSAQRAFWAITLVPDMLEGQSRAL